MVVRSEPARNEMVGEPGPPADHQHRLHEEFDDGHRHEGERVGREDEQELLPEHGLVAVLDGVEPGAIEEIQPHGDGDLGLIDEDEKNDHRDRDASLRRAVGGKRPDAGARGFVGVEVAVGDAHDLSDRRELRHSVDENREDRDGKRQRLRRLLLPESARPESGARSDDGKSEHQGFDREDADENFQEARYAGRAVGRDRADEGDCAEERGGEVHLQQGLHERRKAEQREGDAQGSHGLS